jgi:hypothetical protein
MIKLTKLGTTNFHALLQEESDEKEERRENMTFKCSIP